MSLVNHMLNELDGIRRLSLSANTAEKARIDAIKSEASSLFDQAYQEYNKLLSILNTQLVTVEHYELHICIAEVAFMTERQAVARKVLERYFQTNPQKDQLYCRGKQLLGLIINYEARETNGERSIYWRKLALAEIMMSLQVAISPDNASRYKFLVFNTSISCWQVVQPFLRAGRAKEFTQEMNKMAAALETIDYTDKNWRIMYLSATAVCFDDEKKAKEASDLIDKALEHAEFLLSKTIGVEQGVLADVKAATTETESIMSAVRRWEEREALKNKPRRLDPDSEDGYIKEEPLPDVTLEGLDALGYDELKTMLDAAQAKKAVADEKLKQSNDIKGPQLEMISRLYMQRIHVNQPDSKKIQGLPQVTQSLRLRTFVTLQCIVSGCIPDKDWQATFDAIIADLDKAPTSSTKVETLLDVCRVAWQLNLRNIAIKCNEKAESASSVNPFIRIKLDLCKALRIVSDIEEDKPNEIITKRLGSKEVEGYAVSRRIEAIKIIERLITMFASRKDDNALLQEICVMVWNISRPLLQPHLRSNVHRALELAAGCLESMASPLLLLRSQLHSELAKCEEASDFVMKAFVESKKSINADYGSTNTTKVEGEDLDRNRPFDHIVKPFSYLLDLRSNVYDSPSDIEGQVLLLLQQVKESNSRSFQADMLQKALYLMLEETQHEQSSGPVGSMASLSKSKLQIPEKQFDELNAVTMLVRTGADLKFEKFTILKQKRIMIMASIARFAHAARNTNALQHAASYVLSALWNTADDFMREIIDTQIEMHFLLADSLVDQLAKIELSDDTIDMIEREEMELIEQNGNPTESDGPLVPDPRTLGLTSKFATDDMLNRKKLAIAFLQKGMTLALAVKDQWGAQNAIIYFWNLHLHVFRKKQYSIAMNEVFEFVQSSCKVIDDFIASGIKSEVGSIDSALRLSLVEALSSFYDVQGQGQLAIDVATKGCASGPVYIRKRLCEHTSALVSKVGAANAGAKGAKPVEAPKYDDPFLNVFGTLAQCELPDSVVPRDQQTVLSDKAIALMDTEVKAKLAAMDWNNLTQEDYDQYMEMQAECYTRLTRIKIRLDDIHGSQLTAEKCMELVADGIIRQDDEKKLSPRVWRWMSVCERYFGVAISMIIQPEGQDASLQYELRLAAMRHFTLSCNYALRAKKEELVVAAATNAWNVSIPLVEVSEVRSSLSNLQRQVLDALLNCGDDNEQAAQLKQQYYLAMIDEQAQDRQWDAATKIVFEAFDNVPSSLLKPLWRWRVIVVSKKGKSVLDALQKLKEGDPSLQARVYATLARSASVPKQQLEAYSKTMEILSEDLERVDYMLETAQWMSSAGVPRPDINQLLLTVLDALYEIEGKDISIPDNGQAVADDASMTSAASGSLTGSIRSAGSKTSARGPPQSKTSARRMSKDSTGSAGSRGLPKSGRSSRRVSATATKGGGASADVDEGDVTKLNAKYIEVAVRALSMTSILEYEESARLSRCLEASYFVEKYIQSWVAALLEYHKSNCYMKLSREEQDATPYDAYVPPSPASAVEIPLDPIKLLSWLPSESFTALMTSVTAETPLDVPSVASLGSMPFTIYYSLWSANALYTSSYPKQALLRLGWLRAMLLFLPDLAGKEAALAAIHYKAMNIMHKTSLSNLASTLPAMLGNTTVNSADYLISVGMSKTPTTIPPVEVNAFDKTNTFGYYTYTQTLEGVDVQGCCIEIAKDLLELGQHSLCGSLTLSLRVEFALRQNVRGLLQTSLLLAQLDYSAGRYRDAMAMLLSSLSDFVNVSDAQTLASGTMLLVNCYNRMGQIDESKKIAKSSMVVLEGLSSLIISTSKDSDKGETRPTHSRSQTSHTNSNTVTVAPQTESNYDNVHALLSVVIEYSNTVLIEAEQLMSDGKDPRPLYDDMNAKFAAVQGVVSSTVGVTSMLNALVLERKAMFSFVVLSKFHAMGSKFVGINGYSRWLEENYLTIIESMEAAVDIRRGMVASISINEQTEFYAESPQALSLYANRSLAQAETELAYQYITLAVLRADNNSGLSLKEAPKELDVIEKFLEATKPEAEFKMSDFYTPPIFKASELTSSASQLLANTGLETESDNIFSIAVAMRLTGAGTFDCVWKQPENLEMSTRATSVRQDLVTCTIASIAAGKLRTAALGSSTLVDCFGSVQSSSAICWIMQLQSIAAREWLMKVWRNALVPTSEIFHSLNRLDNLEKQFRPTAALQNQMNLEQTFLKTSSAAWRRLDVTKDPSAILLDVPATTFMFCLQFCPHQKTLYCCIGRNKPDAPTNNPYEASGEWCVDKIQISEDSRRMLEVMKTEHSVWKDDTTKFIAAFGDNMSPEQDLDGIESQYPDKRLRKTEAALEERIRALLSDIDNIFSPLLGAGGVLDSFVNGKADGASSVMMLLDPSLQALPWEGLEFFTKYFQGRISRDFSLHMLGHRLSSFATPGGKGQIPPIASSAIKAAVDLNGEDIDCSREGYQRDSITKVVTTVKSTVATGGSKWGSVGKAGSIGTICVQDWLDAVQASNKAKPGVWYFYSPGRIGSVLSPRDLSVMNIETIACIICTDMSHNDTSFRRQNSTDNQKQRSEVLTEAPLQMSALASLSGCGSLLMHFWSTSFSSQARYSSRFWDALTKQQKNISHANALANGPIRMKNEQDDRKVKDWIRLSRVVIGLSFNHNDA